MARERPTRRRAQLDRQTRRHERQRRFMRVVGYSACLVLLGVATLLALRSNDEPAPALPPPVTVTAPRSQHTRPAGMPALPAGPTRLPAP